MFILRKYALGATLASLPLLSTPLLSQTAINPGATIWRNGAAGEKFPTIQAAINAAQDGDTVKIAPGIHHEIVTIKGSHPNALVTIDGTGATVDGADPGLQAVPNTRWKKIAEGVYEAQVPWSGDPARAPTTWVTPANGPMLAAYYLPELWQAMSRGPGTRRVGTTLSLQAGTLGNPNNISLSAGVAEAVVKFADASGWKLENVELLHGGSANLLIGENCHDITIDHVTAHDAFLGITTEPHPRNTHHLIVRNCTIGSKWNDTWPWREGYKDADKSNEDFGGPLRGTAINIYASDCEVAFNTIEGSWDGMGMRGRNLDIHDNTISHCNDDAVELESGASSNVRFHDNLIYNVFDGISVISDQPGPIYVYRNRVSSNRLDVWAPATDKKFRFGYGIKLGADWGIGAQKVYIYQNTFYDQRLNLWDKESTVTKDFQFLNNIFVSVGRRDLDGAGEGNAIWSTGLAENGIMWNGNLYFRPNGRSVALFRLWNGHRQVASLQDARALYPAWEVDGQQADPRFAKPLDPSVGVNNDFTLAADSPARDHGTPLPKDWPDSIPASNGKPTVGALPYPEPAK